MRLFSLVTIGIITVALGAAPVLTQVPQKQVTTLILSPQGLDPSNDPDGLNAFYRESTQPFANAIEAILRENGRIVVNVLDQKPKYDIRAKIAIHSIDISATTTILLTVEVGLDGVAKGVFLRAQYLEYEPIMVDGTVKGVKILTTLNKNYMLGELGKGADKMTTTERAIDFVNFLKKEGRL